MVIFNMSDNTPETIGLLLDLIMNWGSYMGGIQS